LISKHAVVIGAGLGGLAVALRLARRGLRVTVVERGERPGGKMNRFEAAGFRFDTGPSLLTMPWVFRDLYRALGEDLDERLTLRRLDPTADHVWPDGTRLTTTGHLPTLLDGLGRLHGEEPEAYLELMALGAKIYQLSEATFLSRSPFEAPDVSLLGGIGRPPVRGAWGNYSKVVRRICRTPYLAQLFERYPTYVGSSPYRSPATLLVIPYLEAAFGAWFLDGGLYRLVEDLMALAEERELTIRTGSEVVKIEREGGTVSGVVLASGERLAADVVVMNGDPSALPWLLGEHGRGLPRRDRSLSGVVFLLGLARSLPELAHHSVYFSADYPKEFSQLFDERRFPTDPTVYVNAPSRSDRSLVPEQEGETLFVMANAPADGDVRSWDAERVAVARERMFERLAASGFPEVAPEEIVVEEVWTPERWSRELGAPGGAIYGTHSHGWRRAFLRPGNRQRRPRGLYLVGGGTHPGGGTPTVLLSAAITDRLIGDDL
jgi:phytoene desaturase